MQEFHTRPIKGLVNVAECVVKLQNIMADCVRAGGVQALDVQLKANLLRILPR